MTGKWRLLLKMKKKNLVAFLCLTSLVILSVFSLGIGTLAWFVASYDLDPKILGGTAGTYFESGDGSEEKPYIISNPRHLYNLAWLQYLGEFNKDEDGDGKIDKQYYFRIKDGVSVLNMSLWALPPIGTTKYPFVGNFNGNGCTIQNLSISNSISDLSFHPLSVSKVQDCSIIGFFGVVGSIGTSGMSRSVNVKGKNGNVITADYTSYTEETGSDNATVKKALNSVHDYYLDNEKIISNPDALGSSSSDPGVLTGFLVGYANGEVKNAGLHSGTMELVSGSKSTNIKSGSGTDASVISDNISDYTLIGAYDAENYNWEDKAGSDVGYGNSTDLHELFYTLGGEDGESISKYQAFPFRPESTALIQHDSGGKDKTPMKLSSGTKAVGMATTQKGSSKGNNIGYFAGSDLKLYNSKVPDVQSAYAEFYYPDNATTDHELPWTDANGVNHPAPSADIVSYLTSEQKDGNGNSYYNGSYLLRFSSSAQIDIQNESGLYAVEQATVGKWSGTLLIPNRCIWVAPVSAGTMRFVVYNPSDGKGFRLEKVKRSTPGDYSSYFTSIEKVLEFNALLLAKHAYYFEVNVTDKDIASGTEFILTGGNGGTGYKPYFAYIDMGAVGDSAGKDGDIKNIDFVTTADGTDNGAIVKMTDSSYTKSGVLYKLNGIASSQVTYSFKRSDGPSDTNVRMIRTSSGNGVNLTVIGKENQAIDRSTGS